VEILGKFLYQYRFKDGRQNKKTDGGKDHEKDDGPYKEFLQTSHWFTPIDLCLLFPMIPQGHRKAHFFLRNGDLISFSGLINTSWVRLKVTFAGHRLVMYFTKMLQNAPPCGRGALLSGIR
jgi:hypothetical protein